MKRLILLLLSVLMLAITGCGSEITLVVPMFQYAPPTITRYDHSQDKVYFYVDGTVDFYAPDSDLDTITITVCDSRGVHIENSVISLGAYSGQSSGTISFSIDYINYRPDDYSFTIYLTDRWGYISNPVYGYFRV